MQTQPETGALSDTARSRLIPPGRSDVFAVLRSARGRVFRRQSRVPNRFSAFRWAASTCVFQTWGASAAFARASTALARGWLASAAPLSSRLLHASSNAARRSSALLNRQSQEVLVAEDHAAGAHFIVRHRAGCLCRRIGDSQETQKRSFISVPKVFGAIGQKRQPLLRPPLTIQTPSMWRTCAPRSTERMHKPAPRGPRVAFLASPVLKWCTAGGVTMPRPSSHPPPGFHVKHQLEPYRPIRPASSSGLPVFQMPARGSPPQFGRKRLMHERKSSVCFSAFLPCLHLTGGSQGNRIDSLNFLRPSTAGQAKTQPLVVELQSVVAGLLPFGAS